MKRASRHAHSGRNKRYFPAVDNGNHEYFNQITVPPAPAPVKAIVRRGPDCYIAQTPGRNTRHPDFGAALKALYPALRLCQ